MDTNYVPGNLQSALHTLFTEWVTTIPGGKQYYYPSFTGNEAGNRRLEKLSNFPNITQHVSEGARSA